MLELDVSTLRELVRYDPRTGKLYWNERPAAYFSAKHNRMSQARLCAEWNDRYAGQEAFSTEHGRGYLSGDLLGVKYKAHRVAWAIYHGAWPQFGIDHIDGDPSNNRIENLRSVPQSVNGKNQKLPRNNTSGNIGVWWSKRYERWFALIIVNGRRIHLGTHHSEASAVNARKAAEVRFGFHPNHGRKSA